jgi:hypothetical protein
MKKKEMKLQSEIITNMHELFGETLCSRTKTMHKTKLLHVMKTCSILSREVSESQNQDIEQHPTRNFENIAGFGASHLFSMWKLV